MTLSLTNTLTRTKEPLGAPTKPVTLYTCGPTVYNRVHVGNLRAFLFYDVRAGSPGGPSGTRSGTP